MVTAIVIAAHSAWPGGIVGIQYDVDLEDITRRHIKSTSSVLYFPFHTSQTQLLTMISLHSSGGHTKPINRSTFLITFFFLVFILNGLYYTRRFPFSLLDCDEQEARIISPQELLARPLTSDLTTVPQIFHQSWSSSELPAKFEKWSRSCRRAHPDWEWVLWTDEDNYELVLKHAPWFLETYSQLAARAPVYQADVVRNLYMHVFGGYVASFHPSSDPPDICVRPSYDIM